MQGCPLLNNEVKCMCPLGLGHFMVQTLKCVGVFCFLGFCCILSFSDRLVVLYLCFVLQVSYFQL